MKHENEAQYCCVLQIIPCNVIRTLPLSILIGILVVAVSYLLVNISFFATLSYEQILNSDAVALVGCWCRS